MGWSRRSQAQFSGLLILLLEVVARPAAAQVPAGDEFILNVSSGYKPSAAMNAVGDFVVSWVPDSYLWHGHILARRFDAVGNARGSEFAVSTFEPAGQGEPAIASDATGNFVVAWTSGPCCLPPLPPGQDGSETGVIARRYDEAGSPRDSEFVVNTFTTSEQRAPSVASDAAGNFILVWTSEVLTGTGHVGRRLQAQRFDASGAARGGEFAVQAATTGYQQSPVVAAATRGDFVIVWQDVNASGRTIRGRRYDAAGSEIGAEFLVTAGPGWEHSVSMGPDGSFVAVWTASDDDWSGVFGRRYSASGLPLGASFQINSTTTGFQNQPSVALDGGGAFVVAWKHIASSQYPFASEVRAQRFDASGAARGAEFRVDTPWPDPVAAPSAMSDANGNFVVVWHREFSRSGFARRFGGLVPAASSIDGQASPTSDGNGVVEPGEGVEVRPSWRNVNGASQTFGGAAIAFGGPPAPGVSYQLQDGTAGYGTVANATTAACTDCYSATVSFADTRPATHWDAIFEERLTPDELGQSARWLLHVGESFTDVPRTSDYYRFVETLLHHGVTAGCAATTYCPAQPVTRQQMAVFVLVAGEGSGYVPPACGVTPVFGDVPVTSPYCPWVEELARRGVVDGCGGGNYCPGDPVSRDQVAVFVLRTAEPSLVPLPCAPPDLFADVPGLSPFCPWVEELARRGVVSGCGGGNYCPSVPVTREQMSVFISVTFDLVLYGP